MVVPTRIAVRWLMFVIALVAVPCRKDDPVEEEVPTSTTGTLRIHVVPEWHGEAFQPFTEYRAPLNYRFQAEMVRFCLSDISVVNGTDSAMVKDVALLDLGDGPFDLDLTVPAGSWFGLKSGLGLPDALNHSDPALYANGHPLSVSTGMSWNWNDGYKFVLFDGRFDPDPEGAGSLLSPFSVHTGMDTCYTVVDLFPAVPFNVSAGGVTELTLRIDVYGFLQSATDTINVSTENLAHGSNFPLALKLTRNVSSSLYMQ